MHKTWKIKLNCVQCCLFSTCHRHGTLMYELQTWATVFHIQFSVTVLSFSIRFSTAHLIFFLMMIQKYLQYNTDRICFMRAFLMKAIQFWPVKQLEHFESKNRFCGAIWKNLWKKTMQHHPSKCIHQTNENWKCGVLIYSFHFALPRYWNGFMLPNLILFVWFSSSASLLILAEHSRRMQKKIKIEHNFWFGTRTCTHFTLVSATDTQIFTSESKLNGEINNAWRKCGRNLELTLETNKQTNTISLLHDVYRVDCN